MQEPQSKPKQQLFSTGYKIFAFIVVVSIITAFLLMK